INAGVSITPCGVSNLAIRPARSVYLTSNLVGDTKSSSDFETGPKEYQQGLDYREAIINQSYV
ncbi:MAG TPA: hypothetical protein VFH25_01750, partial [Nitrososphaeraceae archaeon]|nr:hypothetical protein [Nitrososphaeraceae archaeon]